MDERYAADQQAKQRALTEWLEGITPKTYFNEADRIEVSKLLALPGFRTLLCSLQAEREAFRATLEGMPLTNQDQAARASVLQGQIKGIDRIRHHLLDILVPDATPQEETNG